MVFMPVIGVRLG